MTYIPSSFKWSLPFCFRDGPCVSVCFSDSGFESRSGGRFSWLILCCALHSL